MYPSPNTALPRPIPAASLLFSEASASATVDQTNDRPFNGFRRVKSRQAKAVFLDVLNQVQNYEMHRVRSRARRKSDQRIFEQQIEALVCDLIHREISYPGAWLAVSFSKQVLGRKNRYRSAVLSETLPAVIQHMAASEMEFVEIIKGARNPFDAKLSRQTVIRAGKRLRDRIVDHQLALDDFSMDKTQEIIILKDTKEDHWDLGAWLQYEDTAQTTVYRNELARINDWLEHAAIEYVPYYDSNELIDTTDRKLRRYFNNGCFEQGGRIFGGFWQHMTRSARHGIVIDGMDTVTLDYGQMIARVLYGYAGKPYELDDAYCVPGMEGHRDGVKKVFSAMLYSERPLQRMPQGCRDLFPAKWAYADVANRITDFHRPISEFLYAGVGPKLTYQESSIILTVLTQLIELGITALPIYDAVIVPEEHQDQVEGVMLETFKKLTGIEGVVTPDQ